MNSKELVAKTIRGENTGRTPVYGWVSANLKDELTEAFGSVENFEDHYEYDMAHIFGGPNPHNGAKIRELRLKGVEITPGVLLDIPMMPVDRSEDYQSVIKELEHHSKQRNRFCYIQTPGIFECLNGVFGIQNHLMYLALYPDELKEVYKRQAKWNAEFANHMIDLGIDMVHVSDDWGAQRGLMFSLGMWKEMIFPYHKIISDSVKARGKFLSLHTDGCVVPALDGIVELGYDLLHPWQEVAGMPYDLYLNKYSDKLAILGGLCIQSTLGFGDYKRLESEIRRVFSILKGKRWMLCTTHFVQKHCTIDELVFAYDLVVKLARE